MFPKISNYAVYPSVVPADRESRVTIVPTENAHLLFDGETYNLTFIAVNGDEDYYHSPHSHKKLSAVAENGVISVSFTFEGEGEHLILLNREGSKNVYELNVYSLYPDLLSKRVLKGDFHSHSYRSDGARDPAALAGHYREQGYDFFALTDHNRYYPGEEIDHVFSPNPIDFSRVLGEEVHAPGNVVHIIHVGGKSSVAALYVNDPESYEKEAAAYEEKVPVSVPEKYRSRYARCEWVCDKIHEAGGLAIFVHPYWKPGKAKCFNVCDEFAKILLMSGMFDTYELVGGMGQEGVNRSIALWADLRAEGLKISVVGSSDVHKLENVTTFPHYFTLCFADANENDAIIDAVKNGLSVAVEAIGAEYGRQYRAFGSLRLVSYAHFLLRCYYPVFTRICQGEGVAMRAYAAGHTGKEILEALAKESNRFRKWFFGEEAAALPSEEIRKYVENRREIQRNGPNGKGSLLGSGNTQI